jgi:two-component system response regulator HydG/two-component system response regulator AtoC
MLPLKILLADDDPAIRATIAEALREGCHEVVVAADGAQALEFVREGRYDLLITDMRMPKLDGMALFRRVRAVFPEMRVIMMTAFADVTEAVSSLKDGAVDYLVKPFDLEELEACVQRVAERRAQDRELAHAREALRATNAGGIIVGRSAAMLRLLDLLPTIAVSNASVLLTGESGTGKELVARTIHSLSDRRDHRFVAVNCAAFPETLLEAELFGHEQGAFTGAAKARAGRFRAAAGGTLFLDELGEIPPAVQAKLLRVVQENAVEPLGSNNPVPVDVRIVSATHRNLRERIREGLFREDLFYRINVLDVAIPSLRERLGDLPLLVEHFLTRRLPPGSSVPTISPRAWAALSSYSFPGNVRELEHAIERGLVLSKGEEIDVHHLPPEIGGTREEVAPRSAGEIRPLSVAMKEFEREYLVRALEHNQGKKARAAQELGISRKNLWEKLRALGVELRRH